MSCISHYTNGSFYNINNTDDFDIIFTKVLNFSDNKINTQNINENKSTKDKKIEYKNYMFEFIN